MTHSPSTVPSVDQPRDARPGMQLRSIIERLVDGIVIVDRRGVIRFANPAAARLFDRTTEALVGTEFGTPVVGRGTTEMEIVRRGGGEVVFAELRVVGIDWEGESVELVSLRDITDRKHAEERARQLTHERDARLEAEAASRAKSEFLAIMSHELRTPLNAILGYSELIELGIAGEVPPPVRDHVSRIRRAARHLLGLVNDILDLAKFDAGRFEVTHDPVAITEAVASALSLVMPQAETRNLALTVAPAVTSLPDYIGDDERVRQILVNLLSNAVKCTDPGGSITVDGEVIAAPVVGARLPPRGTYLKVSVSDTGMGISAEHLATIFEPFVQADTGPKRTREGSGLGLTICLRLARAMGGDITVVSAVGEGSTFTLWLPASGLPDVGGLEHRVEAAADIESLTRQSSRVTAIADLRELDHASRVMMAKLGTLVDIVVSRIRSDGALAMASGLRTSQVADHLGTLFANIADALLVIAENEGESSALLSDSVAIQRMIAEQHGAQRARLGWNEASLRREFMIMREELERVVLGAVPHDGTLQEADALSIVRKLVDQAEYLSVRGLERAQ